MRRLVAALLAAVLLTASNVAPVAAHNDLLWRINHYRENHELRRLRTNDNLHDIAHLRARQIVTDFNHDFWWWSRTGCEWVGEIIAYRKPAPDNPSGWLFRAWRNSPPHRATMLGDWGRAGASYVITADGALYGAVIFCKG